MTAFVNGIIIAKRLGTINAVFSDAPYTVSKLNGQAAASTNNQAPVTFAEGSMYPTLYNVNLANLPGTNTSFFTKINAAILRTNAPTLIVTGVQDGLGGSGGNGFGEVAIQNGPFRTPSYYGGFLGLAHSYRPSLYLSMGIAAPFNIGSTQFPLQFQTTTLDSSLGQVNAQTFVVNYNNGWAFAIMVATGSGGNLKFFIFGPSGNFLAEVTSTNGPWIKADNGSVINGGPLPGAVAPFYVNLSQGDSFTAVRNVICTGFDTNPPMQNKIILVFLDQNFNAVFMRYVTFDDATLNTALLNAPIPINIKVTTSGFLISYASGTVPYGYHAILLSHDGTSYAPINFKLVGPIGRLQGPIEWDNTSITIDPDGIAWYACLLQSDPTKIYVGNTFGANLQIPIPAVTPYTPSLTLPCYTPCDIATLA